MPSYGIRDGIPWYRMEQVEAFRIGTGLAFFRSMDTKKGDTRMETLTNEELIREYRKAIKKAQRLLRKERTSGTVRAYWKTAIESLTANLKDLVKEAK